MQAADEAVTAYGVPSSEHLFLHGDVWPGNLLWSDDEVAARIDWKTAGVGATGVDLCELRKQAAISFGPDAPAEVLHGYEQATSARAEHVAYWDAVAALNTLTELYDTTATARRNAFLREALTALNCGRHEIRRELLPLRIRQNPTMRSDRRRA